MKVLATLIFVGILVVPVFGQDKKAATLAELKKDLVILNLRKENAELRYSNIIVVIKQIEARIKRMKQEAEVIEKETSSIRR